MLKEVISDKKQTAARRLQAGQTLLEVYARHDRSEAVRDALRRASEASTSAPTPSDEAHPQETGEESTEQKVDRFLATYRRKESVNG